MDVRPLLQVGLLVVGVPYVMAQARKPDRFFGRVMLRSMNASHSALTDWGLEHVTIATDSAILDVGCGGGRTIEKLAARASAGHVAGVDFASGSVAASRAHNAKAIAAGRVEVQRASVSELPFPDASFDLVTAVETHYYWPRRDDDLREVRRVVKPGGTVVVIAESYRGGKGDAVLGPALSLLGGARLTADQHREWFSTAGFSEVQVFEEPRHGWICVTGKRPE